MGIVGKTERTSLANMQQVCEVVSLERTDWPTYSMTLKKFAKLISYAIFLKSFGITLAYVICIQKNSVHHFIVK